MHELDIKENSGNDDTSEELIKISFDINSYTVTRPELSSDKKIYWVIKKNDEFYAIYPAYRKSSLNRLDMYDSGSYSVVLADNVKKDPLTNKFTYDKISNTIQYII